MISTIVIYFITLILGIPLALLLAISWVMPTALVNVVIWAAQYLRYLRGWLPLMPDPTMTGPVSQVGMIDLIMWSMQFIAVWYFFKIMLRVLGFIRPGSQKGTKLE